VESIVVKAEGRDEVVRGTHLISSMPMRELVRKLAPAPRLKFRDDLG
jgi:hypothetical protein